MAESRFATLRPMVVATVTAALAVALSAGVTAAKTTLTVYTAIEADDLKKYAARFTRRG